MVNFIVKVAVSPSLEIPLDMDEGDPNSLASLAFSSSTISPIAEVKTFSESCLKADNSILNVLLVKPSFVISMS